MHFNDSESMTRNSIVADREGGVGVQQGLFKEKNFKDSENRHERAVRASSAESVSSDAFGRRSWNPRTRAGLDQLCPS